MMRTRSGTVRSGEIVSGGLHPELGSLLKSVTIEYDPPVQCTVRGIEESGDGVRFMKTVSGGVFEANTVRDLAFCFNAPGLESPVNYYLALEVQDEGDGR